MVSPLFTKINRIVILSVVLCGCKTRPLTFREERRLRVFENMVLRRIFGFKRHEVTVEWSRLLDSTQCTQLASRLSNITTVTTGEKMIGSENAV